MASTDSPRTMTDFATVSPNGGGGWSDWVAVELSTGAGFASAAWAAHMPQHMRNGGSGADYQFIAGDYDGDGRADLAAIAANGGGGWASWVAIELSTGAGFYSTVWAAATPQHMRNGDSWRSYRVFGGDFAGTGRTSLVTVSRNGGGAWSNWFATETSTGSGFTSGVWATPTPQHIRNGG